MNQRSLHVLLFASLALNLFILGAVAGVLGLGARLHARHGPPRGGPMAAAARSLPPEEARAFRDVLREAAGAVAPQIRQARELRRDAFQRLGADPVDTAAIFKDLDAARAQQIQAQDAVDHRIIEFAAKLPRDERVRFGQALVPPPRPARPGGPPPP